MELTENAKAVTSGAGEHARVQGECAQQATDAKASRTARLAQPTLDKPVGTTTDMLPIGKATARRLQCGHCTDNLVETCEVCQKYFIDLEGFLQKNDPPAATAATGGHATGAAAAAGSVTDGQSIGVGNTALIGAQTSAPPSACDTTEQIALVIEHQRLQKKAMKTVKAMTPDMK